MKISIVRGAFLNPFELQNYYPLAKKHKIQAISSRFPISDRVKLPLIKLWSPTDLPLPFKYPLLNRLIGDAHYLLGLEKAIVGSDVVHVAETYYHYTLQAIKAKRRGQIKKVVSTVWEVLPHNNESLPGRKKIKEISRREIDHFIAITEVARQTLIQEGIAESKITVIPMGVDLDRFHPTPKPRQKVRNILYVGRLVEEKGIGELVAAFNAEKTQNKNLTLTIIGSGPLKHRALSAGAKVKVVPYKQIHREYQNADLLIFPTKPTKTWTEQFGMVLVEALACGLPIIASSTPVIREVGGDAALYFLPGDELQLTSQLHHLLADDKLRSQLAKAARARAKRLFDHRQIAKQILKVYQA